MTIVKVALALVGAALVLAGLWPRDEGPQAVDNAAMRDFKARREW